MTVVNGEEMGSNNGKYSTLTKNVLLFTISSFGSKIIQFLLVPLYTSVLSTGDYGTVDLINTTVQLLIPLLTLNMQDAVLRFCLDDKYKKEDILAVSLKVNLFACLALGITLTFLYASGVVKLDGIYLLFLYVSYFLGAIFNTIQMYLKADNKVAILAIDGIINTLVSCVLNLLLLLVVKWGVYGYMLANATGLIVADAYAWVVGRIGQSAHKGNPRKKIFREMFVYSAPLIANSLAWWINNASDRYILTAFRGVSENGIYSVSYKIPSILSVVTTIFYNAWSISAITEFDENDSDGFMGNSYSAFSMLTLLACSAIMIINIPLARILYAKDFFAAWKCVPFLLAGAAFNALGLFDGCIYTAVKKTGDVSKTTLIGAGVNTGLNFILIYFFGSIGAALATMVGYLTTFAMRTKGMSSFVHLRTNWIKHYVSYGLLILQAVLGLNEKGWIFEIPIFVLIFILYRQYISLAWEKIKQKTRR